MRTKTLLLSAATLAAGVATSMAANVYSVNVVGYVNLTLVPGFNMVQNPLDGVGGGTGTGNTITTALTALPDSTTVYQFSGGGFNNSDVFFNGVGWVAGGTIPMNPGQGLFIQIPAGIPGNATNVTFVGTVVQGPTTASIPSGFSISGSQAPIAGGVTSVLNYAPNDGDTIYQWSAAQQTYPNSAVYVAAIPAWLPSEPTVAVGEAFFLQATAATTWTNTFTVQ